MLTGHDRISDCGRKSQDFFRSLKDVFLSAGYTDNTILKKLGAENISSIGEKDIALLLKKTNGDSPLDTLIRLLLIDVPCQVDSLRTAIHPMEIDAWVKAGLILVSGDRVTARIRLIPFKGLLIAFDAPRMLSVPESARQYVMGIGQSTLTLANAMINRHSRYTLDLGSGCGFLAFMAADHSDRVIGVDRNSHAITIADFNASLNGFTQVTFQEGDLFQPVNAERFDLVITNPPFVISPETQYIYRDGGMEGDGFCRAIVQKVPERLNDGGYCQILCNWIETAEQDWKDRLREWFDGSGCDAWVMRSESRSADVYASTWIRHTERGHSEDYTQQFESWMDYYENRGVKSMGAGVITMRRRSGGKNWFRAQDAPAKMRGPCGASIEQGFALKDLLENTLDDTTFLNLKLRPSPHLRMEQRSMPVDGGWQDEAIHLHLAAGLAFSGTIDPYVAGMIRRCNGEVPLYDLLKEMAAALDHSPESITPSFCQITRGLVEQGFLLPSGIR